MGAATVAACYTLFAVLFVNLNLSSLNTASSAAMHKAITERFNTLSFAGRNAPPKTVKDIETPLDIQRWLKEVFKNVLHEEQANEPPAASNQAGITRVGSFNRILLVRFTAKRKLMQENRLGKFKVNSGANEYPKVSVSSTNPLQMSDNEDKSTICSGGGMPSCLTWREQGSFEDAGGYSMFIDPQEGPEKFIEVVENWTTMDMFDLRLGSFVVDFMAYNTNVDLFQQTAWTFEFDFAGNCHRMHILRAFNLNLFNTKQDFYLRQYILRIALWILIILFVIKEVLKLYSLGLYQHFRHKGALIDAFSLLMCAIVLLTYGILESDHLFKDFEFSRLYDLETQAETYSKLANLGQRLEEQKYLIAFNLLLVFIRAVVLVAELQSNLGLILLVLDASVSNLVSFLGMFLMIMSGFVLLAHFTFGSSWIMMSNIRLSYYTVFAMLTGKPVYDEISKVDEVIAPIFFYGFYIFVLLVMMNVFISILMSGYDTVCAKLSDTDKEDTPWAKLVEELKHDFVDRVVGCAKAVGSFACRIPLVDACTACFSECFSECIPPIPKLTRWSRKSSDTETLQISRSGSQNPQRILRRRLGTDKDWICMTIFMLTYTIWLCLQTRGSESYQVDKATMTHPITLQTWTTDNPWHVENFTDMKTFSQLHRWAQHAIVGLYSNTKCAITDNTSLSEGTQGCSGNEKQLVQIINNWNFGFMYTTFVRLTIQPACFLRNPDARWATGDPWLRQTPDTDCSRVDCTSLLEKYECYSSEGRRWDMGNIRNLPVGGTNGTMLYNFSNPGTDLGSYGLLGGFVFSLGTTEEECRAKLWDLQRDGWFSPKSASMVFDWITYNGNIDMFNYNQASFSLQASGTIVKHLNVQAFPMNINQGGGSFASSRTWILVLFSTYTVLVVCFMLEMVHRIHKLMVGKRFTKFLHEFCSKIWNLMDLVSLVLSIITIVLFVMFAMMPFRKNYKFSINRDMRYQVPNDDAKSYNLPKKVDPARELQEDWYIFWQFERVQGLYASFLIIAAVNSFFISIKVAKYVGALEAVRPLSGTLDSGKERNSYFAIIIFLLLIGFALFFHIIFGEEVPSMGSWGQTIVTLFEWMTRNYDMMPLLEKDELVACFGFVIFMVTFMFIAVNMFLATMLRAYCKTVGEQDLALAKRRCKPKDIVIVNYRDKAMLQEDLKPDDLEIIDGEVLIRDLRQDSVAARDGVHTGLVLTKVNGDPRGWRESGNSVQEIFESGFPSEGEINLEFTESHHRAEMGFSRFLSFIQHTGLADDPGGEVSVKPTCKNFWRLEGAVACISREVGPDQADEAEEEGSAVGETRIEEDAEQAAEGGSDSEEELANRKAPDTVRKAARRLRTKKRLDALLFSRWSDGRAYRGTDGAVGTGHGWEAFGGSDDLGGQPKDAQYEVEDREIFQLKEEIDKIPVVGQEAWLDCLICAIEREMDDDSIVTEVLRTNEMQDISMKNKAVREKKPIQEFYKHADEVLKMLEYKANKKYYQYLQVESELRQEHLRSQNDVLHDYVCELEREFIKVMELIHKNRNKKEIMLTKLAGLLDKASYRHLDMNAGTVSSGTAGTSADAGGRKGSGGALGPNRSGPNETGATTVPSLTTLA